MRLTMTLILAATIHLMSITEQQIRDSLPVPPYRFKYRITQQSPQIWRVDLLHPRQYTYTCDDVVTVWGFIKSNGLVYPPKNYMKAQRSSVCHYQDIPETMSYTSIVPTVTYLTS